MKVLPILIAVGLLSTAYFTLSESSSDELELKFTNFMTTHARNYQTEAEYNFRKSIFNKNLEIIEEHNSQEKSWFMAVNPFTDWTDSEYKQMLGHKQLASTERQVNNGNIIKATEDSEFTTIDHRAAGLVTPVKNQGACGSCWAFSAVATLEGAYAKETGDLTRFSEAHLNACDHFSDGCLGGWPINGLMFFTQKNPILEEDYPYDLVKSECLEDKYESTIQTLPFAYKVDDEQQSLYKALTHNVVSVAIRAENDDFRHYGGGIIEGDGCGTIIDHGVTLVGYTAEDNAWVVKNSWGDQWGEAGFVRIRSTGGKGTCGINQVATQAVFNIDEY